ncbi:MAG: hypothetical protein OSB47_13400 [Pirellulaceae bacterium]|nr:hypothetical protein [Pirellulaceae bacterium]
MKQRFIQTVLCLFLGVGCFQVDTCYSQESSQVSASPQTPGFYKDLFMSGGVRLSSRKTLPAAESLGLSYEYYAGKDEAKQKELFSGSPADTNGVLLYPDGQPRFRMLYVNGGSATLHGKSLELDGRQALRQFYNAGGSYCGSCAGSFLSGRNVGKTSTRRLGYLHIFPFNTLNTGLKKERVGHFIPDNSPLLRYRTFGDDHYVDDIYHNNGNWLSLETGKRLEGTEILARYDTPDKKPHEGAAIWAYKTGQASGRIVNIGSHPEGITSGERLSLTEACFMYALDGTGQPPVKGTLVNGEVRSMNRETTDKDPAFTKIGDRQTHHFRFDVATGRQPVQIELSGQEGFDFHLFVQPSPPSRETIAAIRDTSTGWNKTLKTRLAPGTWYVSVHCATTVTASKDESGAFYKYTGPLKVLNGVSYQLKASQFKTGSRRGFLRRE